MGQIDTLRLPKRELLTDDEMLGVPAQRGSLGESLGAPGAME